MTLRISFVALALVFALEVRADDKQDPQDAEIVLHTPSVPPPDKTPRTVAIPGPAKRYDVSSKDAGALKGIRALSLANGEARISLKGSERVVRPGDVIEGDVVKAIGDGRIILGRPEAQGEATVIVSFGADGHAIVRVLSLASKSAPALGAR